jgi:hypothetical protein
MRAFPPRLPEQPIFYPVTNEEYAKQIAKDWNTKSREARAPRGGQGGRGRELGRGDGGSGAMKGGRGLRACALY